MQPGAGPVDPTLAGALKRALADIGRAHRVVPARPKRTMLDRYFRRAGVDGMTDPFFLETLIASDAAAVRASASSSRTSGATWPASPTKARRTSSAGWRALRALAGGAVQRLAVSVPRAGAVGVPSATARRVAARLGPGPRADLRAIRERYSPPRQPARVRRRMARLRLVSEGEPGRGRRGELRRGRAAGARRPLAVGWDPLSP